MSGETNIEKIHGNKGKKRSEETKLKMSKANKGKNNHMFGKKHREETKLKIRESNRISSLNESTRLKRIENAKRKQKTVIQLDLNDNIITIWDSAVQAEKNGDYNRHNIYLVCRGERKTHRGYKWQYITNK